MKEEQRKLYISKIEKEYTTLIELKNKLQELEENPLIQEYLKLEASLKEQLTNLHNEEQLAIKETFKEIKCHHDIYVFIEYGNLNLQKFIPSDFLHGLYTHYKCLECGQDFYIRKHDISNFIKENYVLDNLDKENPLTYFNKLQIKYYEYLASNYSTAKAYKCLNRH